MDRWVLEIDADEYPAHLAATPDPPRRLYGIGDPALLRPGLAVVGARRSTPYGLGCARRFAGWAASSGVVIISGAAIGCDQAAHTAALDAAGATVAVLGCGADVVYPSRARALLELIARHGAIVSEAPWGSAPSKWSFVRRNRIIAGLATAVLVVEAGLPSGTFSTADFALDAGRDVLAVPGSIHAPECRGSNRLIRQGATPITDVDDLASALSTLVRSTPSTRSTSGGLSLDPVAAALTADPMRPDDLARELGLDITTVARAVSRLEAAGLVARYPDGRYGPC